MESRSARSGGDCNFFCSHFIRQFARDFASHYERSFNDEEDDDVDEETDSLKPALLHDDHFGFCETKSGTRSSREQERR